VCLRGIVIVIIVEGKHPLFLVKFAVEKSLLMLSI
jgi:hypothetical protein